MALKKAPAVISKAFKGCSSMTWDENIKVPESIMNYWIKQGYKPNPMGVINVKWPYGDMEYTYPLYFEVDK